MDFTRPVLSVTCICPTIWSFFNRAVNLSEPKKTFYVRSEKDSESYFYLYCAWRVPGAEHRQQWSELLWRRPRRWGIVGSSRMLLGWSIPALAKPKSRRVGHPVGRLASARRETGRRASQLASMKAPSLAPRGPSLIRKSSILFAIHNRNIFF